MSADTQTAPRVQYEGKNSSQSEKLQVGSAVLDAEPDLRQEFEAELCKVAVH